MDTELLKKVAKKLATGWELCDSKWQKSEAEWIASQTIRACWMNLERHGEAISWLMQTAMAGPQDGGLVENGVGLNMLKADGSVSISQYEGELTPPEGVARNNGGDPLVIVPTDDLLRYADKFTGGS